MHSGCAEEEGEEGERYKIHIEEEDEEEGE